MLEKVKYPSIKAKLKGMHAKTLSREDIEDLLKQNTIKDAIVILKERLKPLEELNVNASRIELESELDKLIISDINKIYRYLEKKTKKVFDSYILKYKIQILKIIWKDFATTMQYEELYGLGEWTSFFTDLQGIESVKTKEEFLEKLKDKKIKKIFEESESLFDLESMLTKYYYENLYLEAKESSDKLTKLISEHIDIINITTIYRCKKYYGLYEEKYFINYGKVIKKEKIDEIEKSNTNEEIKELLKNLKYKELIDTSIKEQTKEYMYPKYKKIFIEEQFDLCSIIAYFYMKEIEQANIVATIEGIRYNLSKEEIHKQIII